MDDASFTEALEVSLSNMKRLMEQDEDFIRNLLNQNLDTVIVRASSIPNAGLGLFAKHAIKRGTLVSFYPVHGIGVEWGGSASNVAIASLDSLDQDYFQSEQDDNNYRQYLIGNRPLVGYANITKSTPPMFIDVNPNRPLQSGWMSHCINDGAVVQQNTEQGVLDYYKESLKRQNCLQIPFGSVAPLMATVTTRDIQGDEEFLTSYESAYWLETILAFAPEGQESRTPMTPAIQYHIQQSATELLAAIRNAQIKYDQEWSRLGDVLLGGKA